MNKRAYCYKRLKNDDFAFNRLLWLSANWKNMNSLDLAMRFSKLTEMERNIFNSGLSLEETTAFSEKLLEGDNQRVSEFKERCENQEEMIHETLKDKEQALEDYREDLKDWALFRYIKDLDCEGEFEALMIKTALDWCKENDCHMDAEGRETILKLFRDHIERSRNEIEETEGKGAADEFIKKVSTFQA